MKRKIIYTDDKGELEGLESYNILPKDFLPSVEQLILKTKKEIKKAKGMKIKFQNLK